MKWRLYSLWGLFFLVSGIIGWRLFNLQVLEHSDFLLEAQGQQGFWQELLPQRGRIITQDNYPLAINKEYPLVYAVPKEIKNIEKTAESISNILNLDYQLVFSRLNKPDDPYEPLLDRIDESLLEQLDLPGIKIDYKSERYYPEGAMAAQLLGFVDKQGKGRYGLEGFYNDELAGQPGFVEGHKDAIGAWIGGGEFEPAQDGEDLILTLDHLIQFKAEQELAKLLDNYSAQGGSIIILEPDSGTIRAIASLPSFDPNNYSDINNLRFFLNPVIHSQFEPGSVAKLFTLGAALDDNAVSLEDTYYDSGVRAIADHEIHNFDQKAYGQQTISDIIAKSLNLGAIFLVEQISKSTFYNYLKDFGLGEKTGIKLYGELKGDISNLGYKRDINYATAAFGQGISMTPLQLAMAVGAIANDGYLLTPRILADDSINIKRQVISQGTAAEIINTMHTALQGYSGGAVADYNLAAKTGTAQIPIAGGYAENSYIHVLVGFGPIENPKFLILLKLDEPIGVRYAATSLAPAFHNLADFLLQYYKVAPIIK